MPASSVTASRPDTVPEREGSKPAGAYHMVAMLAWLHCPRRVREAKWHDPVKASGSLRSCGRPTPVGSTGFHARTGDKSSTGHERGQYPRQSRRRGRAALDNWMSGKAAAGSEERGGKRVPAAVFDSHTDKYWRRPWHLVHSSHNTKRLSKATPLQLCLSPQCTPTPTLAATRWSRCWLAR